MRAHYTHAHAVQPAAIAALSIELHRAAITWSVELKKALNGQRRLRLLDKPMLLRFIRLCEHLKLSDLLPYVVVWSVAR
jgi:hypothetical protein